jgi:RNA polymerase sigma-70 factor (ECF subfamily)
MEKQEIILLVKQAQSNGTARERACNELFRLYEKPIRAYISSSLLHKPWYSVEVEEMTLEVMARALTRLSQFNPTYYLYVWLRGIATNLRRDQLREKARNKYYYEDVDSSRRAQLIASTNQPSDGIIINDHLNELKHILNQCNPSHRRICELRYLEQRTYSEIYKMTKVPIATVSSILSRVKQKLMRKMKQ